RDPVRAAVVAHARGQCDDLLREVIDVVPAPVPGPLRLPVDGRAHHVGAEVDRLVPGEAQGGSRGEVDLEVASGDQGAEPLLDLCGEERGAVDQALEGITHDPTL